MGGAQRYRLTIRCPKGGAELAQQLTRRAFEHIISQRRLNLADGGIVLIVATEDVVAIRDVVAAHAPNGTTLRIDPISDSRLPQQRTRF